MDDERTADIATMWVMKPDFIERIFPILKQCSVLRVNDSVYF
jgi:hypothetical protein